MERKTVILLLLISILSIASCSKKNQTEAIQFWMWSHAHKEYSVQQWDSLFQKMEDHGIGGLLLTADTHSLKTCIPIAQKHQIEVHAWMWAMNRNDADTSYLSVNALGKSLKDEKAYVDYYKFMCPALPEVRAFVQEKITELTQIDGLSGIHLDYIRYVDVILPKALQPHYGLVQDHIMKEFDYGYHPYMRQLFKEKTGKDPFELEDYIHNPEWLQFRLNELNKTVNSFPSIAHKAKMKISAAVFPSPDMSRKMVRQDWDKWNLDYFFPMVYYNFYNEDADWAAKIMEINQKTVAKEKLYCGLYLPTMQDSVEFHEAVEKILATGVAGISLFEAGAMKEYHYQILGKFKK